MLWARITSGRKQLPALTAWQFGYRALMVTDTAPYRYPHYHTAEDTPEKLDYDRMARAVTGLTSVVQDLASK